MKANKATLGGSLDRPNPAIRFYLFHGADEAGSRALADQLLKGLGAAKFVVSGCAVRGDISLLVDEAGAMSLFGDRRALWIEPAGDEIAAGVEALLASPAVESATIAVAGALKKSNTLLKLAEGNATSWSHASYPLEGREADRLVVELGRAEGLRMSSDIAARIAGAASNNQAVIAAELRKFALYLDASPEAPRELDHDTIERLGADAGEGNWLRLGDQALDGEIAALCEALQRLSPGASEVVPIVRSLQRRLLQLAPRRARIERGERLDSVMASMGKALFWKDKPLMQRLLSRWSATRLAQLGDRVAAVERRLMLSPVPGEAALGEELIAIARAARR